MGKVYGMADEKLAVPKRSKGDAAHAVAKAGLSAVSIVGGPAAELFQYVVQPPLEKRREEWMNQVGKKLQELEARGVSIEDLQNNEQFISAVMYASQLALRTHQTAKLEALRNRRIKQLSLVEKSQSGTDQTFCQRELSILVTPRSDNVVTSCDRVGAAAPLFFSINASGPPTLRSARTLYPSPRRNRRPYSCCFSLPIKPASVLVFSGRPLGVSLTRSPNLQEH